MAFQYNDDIKDARLQVVIDAIADGGKLKIGTAGMALVLATIVLDSPAFVVTSPGIMELQGVPLIDPSADASGIPAAAVITDSADVVIASGLTVGTSGAMIIVSASPIVAGSEIRVESGLIAHG